MAMLVAVVAVLIVNTTKHKSRVSELVLRNVFAERAKKELKEELTIAQKRVGELSKYEHILDVETEAAKILNESNEIADELKRAAEAELMNARNEAQAIRNNASDEAVEMKKQADMLRISAADEYQRIINEANKEAETIAGDAMVALNNKKEIEKTIRAMKNIIEGYGNQYIYPTLSLLDDLADEFGYTEAGAKLKEARDWTKQLIKKELAATCEYAENYRKETAVNFVLDAFNGKVDSILSKAKKDNFGTLKQKILDAYQLVNTNGKAFRDAKVTHAYLDARQEELKWAVIVQELKWKEQEEQRRIREQIREEEKARREYERAIKEAQKDEENIKKLIEKTQRETELQASEEGRKKLELKLQELELRLQEAEAKNQRALSMAQQTKSGNVYVISNIGSFGENVFKIGMTRRLEPLDRIRELGDASVPFEFDIHAMIYSDDAPGLERQLHKKFLDLQINKVNPRKEFFRVNLGEIREEIERMQIDAKWTMLAEARQYRESLVIEEEIRTDANKKEEWERAQLKMDPVSIDMVEEELEA